MLTAQTFRFLAGPQGRATLARLAALDLGDAHTLPLLEALRRDLPPT